MGGVLFHFQRFLLLDQHRSHSLTRTHVNYSATSDGAGAQIISTDGANALCMLFVTPTRSRWPLAETAVSD